MKTRVSLQLQQGFSTGVAAVSRDSPVADEDREAVGGVDFGLGPAVLVTLPMVAANGVKEQSGVIGAIVSMRIVCICCTDYGPTGRVTANGGGDWGHHVRIVCICCTDYWTDLPGDGLEHLDTVRGGLQVLDRLARLQ